MTFVQTSQLVIHFIVAQLMGIIMFYVGLRSYLALNANWTATHIFVGANEAAGVVSWRDSESLGAVADCILSNSYTMISTFGYFAPSCIGPVGPASMWAVPTRFNNLATAVNLTGLGLVVVFIVTLVIELCKNGAGNIGEGRYLAFTYKVQASKAFRILSWIIVVFVVLIICDTIKFLVKLYMLGDGAYLINFSEYLLPTLLTLGYSAYSLGSVKVDPFFNYDTPEFHKLQFSRGWSEVMTDNNAFATQLGVALLKKHQGSDKELKNLLQEWMVPKCSEMEEVFKVCNEAKRPTEKDHLLK